MVLSITHKNELGAGFYTASDIARFLDFPRAKVSRYLKQYWDDRLGNTLFNDTYSWQTKEKGIKAVNFYVLIELYTFFRLQELGVTTRRILEARELITKDTGLTYPFASARIMTDGKKILYKFQDCLVNADGTRQTNFETLLQEFLQKVEFSETDRMVQRFFPAGKDKKIVIDPHHQFGQPIIFGTNLNTEVVFNMFQSGESATVISNLYDITEGEVWDAVQFHQMAA